ncbi:PIR protein [Plasmodium ovale]|nr:PIR protein [Plasmodium ovale]
MDTCITYGNTADEETVESKFKIGCNSFLGEDLNDKLEKIGNNSLIKAKYFYERLINEDTNFDSVISNCSNNENTSFCKALRNFKEKYDNLRDKLEKSSNCKIQNLPETLINKEELSLEDPSGEYELSAEITQESDYSKGTILTGVLIATFGISLFLLLLYKFTMYGPRFHVPKQRKKITWDILSEDALNKLSNTEHEQLNLQNSEFSLKYHSPQ